jgi:hypothetical protein
MYIRTYSQVGLVKTANLDLGTTLLFTGAYNIITGIAFGIPMPVQPMKTIAAVALSETPLTIPQIMAAGIFVSSAVLFLGLTGLIKVAVTLMPSPVIRGMQLGLGLQLAQKGFQMVWYANSKSGDIRQCWTAEGLFLGLFSLVFIGITIYPRSSLQSPESTVRTDVESKPDGEGSEADSTASCEAGEATNTTPLLVRRLHAPGAKAESACADSSDNPCAKGVGEVKGGPRIPTALFLVVVGIVITLVSYSAVVAALSFGPSTPSVIVPSAEDWKQGERSCCYGV